MGDVVDDIDAGDGLFLEQEHRLALLLVEERDQHVRAARLLLAAGLHVEQRPLQHAAEAEGGLRLLLIDPRRDQGRRLLDERAELPPQLIHVRRDVVQHVRRHLVVKQGEQQVLHRHELVAPGSGVLESSVEGGLEVVA